MSTVEVSKILNLVQFKIDNASYTKAIKAIRAVGNEWKRTQSKMNSAMATGRTISGGGGRGGSGGRGGGRFVGPMPSRDMLIARREAMRNQRNEANRSARAQETISAGNIRRTSMFGGAGNAAMGSQVASLNAQLKSGAISLQVYRQSVAALERDFKRASAGGRDFLGTLREVRSAFIALTAANLAFTGGAAVMRTGQMFEGINAAMSMTSDSTSETASKIQFIRDEAYRLGLDLKTAAQGFVQMSVAAKEIMSSGQTQELFTGLSEYSTALGLDQFRFEKALLGFTQIANKGQLMSEEVKNQIGEQLPGALDLFRKAASEFSGKELTTPEFFKMMEKGELLAQDILPLMGKMMSEAAKKGGALEKMLNSNGVAMRRLQQTWTNFQNVIFMSGFGEALTRTFNSLAFALKNNEGAAKSIGVVLGGLVDGFMYFGGTVHDVSLLTYHYLNKYILDPLTQLVPALKEIEGSWVAQAAGVLIAASAFAKLSGFLWSIVKALK
ncbi:MAG: tape measure protein, partial [Bacteroidales bacterium]